MKPSHEYRLKRLNAKLQKQIEFARFRDEEPSTLQKVGSAAAKIGGAAALMTGATYLRGRMAGAGAGVGGALKAGVTGFKGDARAGLGALRGAGDYLSDQLNRIRGGRPRLMA